MSTKNLTAADAPPGRRACRLVAVLLAAAAAGAAVPARAQGQPGMPTTTMMMMGDVRHFGRGTEHLLDGLNATEAQRAQVRQIAQAAAADMKALHDAGRGLREKGLQLLTAPTLDAAAAEALRQQMLAQHDQASKRMLQAMLDVGNVLTPEQRVLLAQRMKQRSEAMRERVPPRGPEQKG